MSSLANDFILYAYPLVIIAGIFGNTLVIILFSKKKFKHTIFSIYFRLLAFTDSSNLLILTLTKFLTFKFNINVRIVNEFLCKAFLIMAYVLPSISTWLLVVISLDRLISIVWTTKFMLRKKSSFQIAVSVFVVVFSVLCYFQLVFSVLEIKNESKNYTNGSMITTTIKKCSPIGLGLLNWLDLSVSVFVPFCLMIIFTSITVVSLFNSRRKNLGSKSVNKRRDVKFAITSVCLSLVFFLLNIPLNIFHLVENYVEIDSVVENLLEITVFLIYYTNFASLFYITVLVNSIFKKEFLEMFKMRPSDKENLSSNNRPNNQPTT
jgi:hypothetical protein